MRRVNFGNEKLLTTGRQLLFLRSEDDQDTRFKHLTYLTEIHLQSVSRI